MAVRCSGEALVACEQRGLEGFCESHVDGIISGEVVAQIPNPTQKYIVGVELDNPRDRRAPRGHARPEFLLRPHIGGGPAPLRHQADVAHAACGEMAQIDVAPPLPPLACEEEPATARMRL